MAISDELNILKKTKADIKSALVEKGLNPTDDFSTYADDIRSIDGSDGSSLYISTKNDYFSFETRHYLKELVVSDDHIPQSKEFKWHTVFKDLHLPVKKITVHNNINAINPGYISDHILDGYYYNESPEIVYEMHPKVDTNLSIDCVLSETDSKIHTINLISINLVTPKEWIVSDNKINVYNYKNTEESIRLLMGIKDLYVGIIISGFYNLDVYNSLKNVILQARDLTGGNTKIITIQSTLYDKLTTDQLVEVAELAAAKNWTLSRQA